MKTKKEWEDRIVKKFSEDNLHILKEAKPETKIEEKLLKILKKQFGEWATAKDLTIFLEVGKNAIYEDEDRLIYKKNGARKKLYYVSSIIIFVRKFPEEKKRKIIEREREKWRLNRIKQEKNNDNKM